MKGNNNMDEMNLNGEKAFDILQLQKNTRVGQRIEKFVFEY